MSFDSFEQQIEALQQQLDSLEQSDERNTQSLQLTEAKETLSQTREELQVAIEELKAQNEELSAANQSIEVERQRYRELFEFAPNGYLVTNCNGVIQEANHTAATLLNIEQKSLLGKPLRVFVAQEERQFFSMQLDQLRQYSAGIPEWELRLQPRQDEPFPGLISMSEVRDSQNKLLGWRWLLRDLTEHKQAEKTQRELKKEQELSELRSRFIQTVSHEYRTPLNVILNSAQILERSIQASDNPRTALFFEKIKSSVEYMNQILEEVLVLRKADTEKLEVNPTLVDLDQFCRNLAEQQQLSDGAEREINFTSLGDSSSVICDAKLLHHILSNLLSNALKYSPEGSTIDFELTLQAAQVTFQIRDQGCGILPEEQSRVLEPFYRGTNIGKVRGTGLGLTIAKKAVDALKGDISLESEVGVGTSFTVTVPVNRAGESKI